MSHRRTFGTLAVLGVVGLTGLVTSPVAAASYQSSGDPAVESGTVGSLGQVLVTSQHLTLYSFRLDKPKTSACTGSCTKFWIPYTLASGARTAKGSKGVSGLGTTKRGRALQVTAHGRRLYRYIGDTAPGMANGEGFANAWFALRPNGSIAHVSAPKPAVPTPSAPPSSTTIAPQPSSPAPTQPAPAATPKTQPAPPVTTPAPPPSTTTTQPSNPIVY